jgi:hypothetical protein
MIQEIQVVTQVVLLVVGHHRIQRNTRDTGPGAIGVISRGFAMHLHENSKRRGEPGDYYRP